MKTDKELIFEAYVTNRPINEDKTAAIQTALENGDTVQQLIAKLGLSRDEAENAFDTFHDLLDLDGPGEDNEG